MRRHLLEKLILGSPKLRRLVFRACWKSNCEMAKAANWLFENMNDVLDMRGTRVEEEDGSSLYVWEAEEGKVLAIAKYW